MPLFKSTTNDTLIERMIQHGDESKDPNLRRRKLQYDEQVKQFSIWKMQKEVRSLKVGDKVDVRDADFIWCVATVILVVEAVDKPTIACVHLEGWKTLKDEFLSIKSPRLAPFGFYTNRFDIPRYHFS